MSHPLSTYRKEKGITITRASCPSSRQRPGAIRWLGPSLGAHTAEVLAALGYDAAAQRALKEQGAI